MLFWFGYGSLISLSIAGGDESVRAIGNIVGKYIYCSEPKENMKACVWIYVEVDLGKGLPEAIKLKVDDWSHV